MNANGVFAPGYARPAWPWNDAHTNTRNNTKLWKIDRPIPILYDTPFEWHHMIPWNMLRDGWSVLATAQRWETLTVWIGTLNVANPAGLISAMKVGALTGAQAGPLIDAICWAKWNLVEGPMHRTDDPGALFDKFATRAASNNLRSRSQTLNLIFTALSNAVAAGAPALATPKTTKSIADEFTKSRFNKNTAIQMFEPAVWEKLTEGKIDHNTGLVVNALVANHPTWRKVK
jgi:hypothetical protein